MIYSFQEIQKNQNFDVDVCVVGSGAGGAVVATELAEKGLSVLLIEEGKYYQTKDFQITDTIKSVTELYRDGGAGMAWGKPQVFFSEGKCVGGSTVVNGGMCWRTPPKILKQWQWEKGLSDLSERKLTPLFERVEERISAKPVLDLSMNRDSLLLKKGAENLGYRVKPNLRAHKDCVGTNQCITGCPTGAKQSTLVSYIPDFLKAGGKLLTECRVSKIRKKGNQIVGVQGNMVHPETKRNQAKVKINAKYTVLSCGAIQTPYLLLKNQLNGPANLVGKNLILHPNAKVVGVFAEEVKAWDGVNQAFQVTEFIDEGILLGVNFIPPSAMAFAIPFYGPGTLRELKKIYHHCVTGAALIEDSSRGEVKIGFGGRLKVDYQLNDLDFHKIRRGMALLTEIFFAAGASRIFLPLRDLHTIYSVDDIKKIYSPKVKMTDLDLMTVHVLGTCQMGVHEKTAVVNSYGKFFGYEGLFIADASMIPSSIGVNPQVTIMALATRVANHIKDYF